MDNFKAAARSLLSTPGPTLLVVATLAIAIGANTAIFSVVNGVLRRPLGYGDDSRLVVVWATNDADRLDSFRLSPADYRDLRDRAESLANTNSSRPAAWEAEDQPAASLVASRRAAGLKLAWASAAAPRRCPAFFTSAKGGWEGARSACRLAARRVPGSAPGRGSLRRDRPGLFYCSRSHPGPIDQRGESHWQRFAPHTRHGQAAFPRGTAW